MIESKYINIFITVTSAIVVIACSFIIYQYITSFDYIEGIYTGFNITTTGYSIYFEGFTLNINNTDSELTNFLTTLETNKTYYFICKSNHIVAIANEDGIIIYPTTSPDIISIKPLLLILCVFVVFTLVFNVVWRLKHKT